MTPTTIARRRPSKREIFATSLRVSGFGSLVRRLPAWRGVVVLTYHRIGDPSRTDLYRRVFSATPETFDSHLRLLQRDFEVIGPDDLVEQLSARRGRQVIVTFDDGYRDLYEVAYPILRANGVRAVMFLCTGFIDGQAHAWWDDIAWACRQTQLAVLPPGPWGSNPLPLYGASLETTIDVLTRRYWELEPQDARALLSALYDVTGVGSRRTPHQDWITWEMAREMQGSGHYMGAHTVSHPVLARLTAAEQLREIVASRERIAAQLGDSPRWLAYPVGTRTAFDAATLEAAGQAGIELAFSNYGGHVTRANFDPLDVRRLPAESLRTPDVFSAALTWPERLAPRF